MSAYLCEHVHVEFLVSAGLFVRDYLPRTMAESNRQAQSLRQENLASLRYRYAEQYVGWTDDAIAADSGVGPQPVYTIHAYQRDCCYFQNCTLPLPARIAQVCKAIACYEYQSCEHPGWRTSEARAYCHALRVAWCKKLPGYEEAEWGSPPLDSSCLSPQHTVPDQSDTQEG